MRSFAPPRRGKVARGEHATIAILWVVNIVIQFSLIFVFLEMASNWIGEEDGRPYQPGELLSMRSARGPSPLLSCCFTRFAEQSFTRFDFASEVTL